MRTIWTTWRRQSRRHPSVLVLTLVALLGFVLGPLLVVAGMPLLGQLVAGVAVAPFSMAVYLCLLPAGPWTDDGGRDDGGPGDGPPVRPDSGAPGGGVDWERFERDFWAHVGERTLVH